LVAGIIFIAWANYSIKKTAVILSYNIAEVPKPKQLSFRNRKNLSNGMPNAYFYNRIKPIFIKAERYNISL
jgi:SanA protein